MIDTEEEVQGEGGDHGGKELQVTNKKVARETKSRKNKIRTSVGNANTFI